MIRILAFGLAALVVSHGIAGAQNTGPGDGQYVLTQPRHNARVNKVDALVLKQKNARKGPGNRKWSPIELKR